MSSTLAQAIVLVMTCASLYGIGYMAGKDRAEELHRRQDFLNGLRRISDGK